MSSESSELLGVENDSKTYRLKIAFWSYFFTFCVPKIYE